MQARCDRPAIEVARRVGSCFLLGSLPRVTRVLPFNKQFLARLATMISRRLHLVACLH